MIVGLYSSLWAIPEYSILPPTDVQPVSKAEAEKVQKVFKEPPRKYNPWFTGPLLTGSGHTCPKGHYNIEPYLYVNNNIGYFNNNWQIQRDQEHFLHNIQFQVPFQVGLTNFLDFTAAMQFVINWEESLSDWLPGDLGMTIGVQLIKGSPGKVWPLKFSISESFPTGNYQNFGSKGGLSSAGGGSFVTSFGLTTSQIWQIRKIQFFALRLSIGVSLPAGVAVTGSNTYGGSPSIINDQTCIQGTNGRVFPGITVPFGIGMEYSLTQNWCLAFDIHTLYTSRTRFRGTPGFNPDGSPVNMGANFNYAISVAPAIEYNFSSRCGLITGVWLGITGLRATDFINYVLAVNFYI